MLLKNVSLWVGLGLVILLEMMEVVTTDIATATAVISTATAAVDKVADQFVRFIGKGSEGVHHSLPSEPA
jgi:hypothetical protein